MLKFSDMRAKNKEWPQYYESNIIIFLFFLVYVIFWYLQGGYRYPVLGVMRFEFLMGAILTVFAIPGYFYNSNRVYSGLGVWVSLLFFIMSIMVVFSHVPEYSYTIFVDRVIKFYLLGFFIMAFVTTPQRLGWFVGAFLLACMKMGQEGLLGVLTGSLVWENQGVLRLHGSTPNYTHPNSFSGMALGTLPFIFYFYRIVPFYLKMILLIQLILGLNIILFTGSRTGYAALFVGLIFLIWKAGNRKKAFTITLISVLLIAPIIPQQYIERAQSMITQEDKEGHSIDARKTILSDAWQVFLNNPLGVGLSAFPAVRQQQFGRSQDTHNLYLEIATNLGIQGLIVFLGFIVALLKTLSSLTASLSCQIEQIDKESMAEEDVNKLEKFRLHSHDLKIMRAASTATLLFIIIRLGLGIFGMDLYEIYWWFALGLTITTWNLNEVAHRRTNLLLGLSKHDPTLGRVIKQGGFTSSRNRGW